jgi:leucyl aminopeptidase
LAGTHKMPKLSKSVKKSTPPKSLSSAIMLLIKKTNRKKPSGVDRKDIDLLVVTKSALEKSLFGRSWVDEATRSQLELKLKQLKSNDSKKSNEESPWVDPLVSPTFDVVKVNFSEGGAGIGFALPEVPFTTFEFHTEIRKLLAPYFKAGTELKLHIEFGRLGKAHSDLVQAFVQAVGHLSQSALWKAKTFGKKSEAPSETFSGTFEFISDLNPSLVKGAFQRGQILGRAANHSRDLTDRPPNDLNPAGYRKHLEQIVKKNTFQYSFLDTKELKKIGAGAFLAVVSADPDTASGIAKVTYAPKKRSLGKVALVGKGLCFDTGGYNIKTGTYMHGMHGDMQGSAVALATLEALAEMQAPFHVTAYLAIAENLISPTAFRPNDVVVACNGMSIEVVDTDAEGRMVLSDTLALASLDEPDLIIDYATLTGSVIRALDKRRSGVYSNVAKLGALAVEVGESVGERLWNFPIGRDYFELLKSEIADIKQLNPAFNADHIYAASFLSRFVGKKIPWLHVDLAAGDYKGGLGLISSDTTGFGSAWTVALLEKYFKN